MEYFDLYDENRFPLNKKIERGSLINIGEYRYTVHICILNDKNQMLIQQRQSNKKSWPNSEMHCRRAIKSSLSAESTGWYPM